MSEQNQKKMDRRTRYTRQVIKDAFLSLKKDTDFNSITVSAICKEAEISRGTFYLHYQNTMDVLDEILDEILPMTRELTGHLSLLSSKESTCCLSPFCTFIRENRKYHCIFLDDSLNAYLVEKVLSRYEETTLKQLLQNSSLSLEQLQNLLCFQFNGCFAVTKKNIRTKEADWMEIQACIDFFIQSGLKNWVNPEKGNEQQYD